MPTNTNGGTTTSLSNTPQAVDDWETAYEDYTFTFDVMANDLGGKAKILWSVDDSCTDSNGDGTADLVTQDGIATACPEYSDLGARVWIENGIVKYDTNALDWLAANQTVCDQFTYAIRLANGTLSWATVYVELTGKNDAPVISRISTDSDAVTLPETDAPLSSSGTLTVRDIDTLDNVDTAVTGVSVTGATGGLTQEQLQAMLQITSGASDAAADSADTSNVTWSFDSGSAAFDHLAVGESLVLTYTVTSTDNHGLSDTHTVTITITGTNDAPVISVESGDSAAAGLGEGNAGLTASGTLTISDVDTSDEVDVSVTGVAVGGTGGAGALTNAQLLAMLDLSGEVDNAADGTAGSLGWSFDSAGEAFDYLAVGETLVLTYTLSASDGHGGSDTQTVTITITGANDAPTIVAGATDAVGGVTEKAEPGEGGSVSDSGTIGFADLDLSDTHSASVLAGVVDENGDPVSSPLGSLTLGAVDQDANSVGWTFEVADGALDFLAAGETLTQVYTVQISDGNGGTVTQAVTIVITGTNDAPVISVESGDSAAAGLGEGNAGLAASGTLTISDVDTSDEVDVSVTGVAVGGTGGAGALTNAQLLAMLDLSGEVDNAADGTAGSLGWSFDSAGEAFDYLAVGETLVLTYTLSASDGHGGSDTQTVTITITGANDAPTIVAGATDAVGGVTEKAEPGEGGSVSDSGTIGFADVDLSDTHSASVLAGVVDENGDPVSSPLGSLTLGAVDQDANSVGWTFEVADGALDFLAAGETLTQVYTVQISDGNGGTVTQAVTIVITGTNDAPTVATQIADQSTDEDNVWSFTVPADTFADVDADTLSYTATLDDGSALPSWLSFNAETHTFSGTPPLNFNGSITLKVTATDGNGGSASDTFNVAIDPVNDAPSGTDNSVTIVEDGSHTFAASDFGFSDPVEGDALQAVIITMLPAAGALTLNGAAVTAGQAVSAVDIAAGLLVYTPAPDGNGDDYASFTFQVRDGGGTVNGGEDTDQTPNTFTIDVTPVDDTPVVADIRFVPNENDFQGGVTAGIIGTFVAFDEDGNLIEGAEFTPVTAGDLRVAADGTLSAVDGVNASETPINFTISSGTHSEPVYVQVGSNSQDSGTSALPTGAVPEGSMLILFGVNGSDTLNGGTNDDTLYGGGNNSQSDTINGSDGDDYLLGGLGTDTLRGNAGNDYLRGGSESDQLIGGAGSDLFVFASPLSGSGNGGIDSIQDFNATGDAVEGDRIVLDDAIFTEFAGQTTLEASQFVSNSTGAAAGTEAQVIFNTSSGALLYDPDGAGGAAAVQFATVTPGGMSGTLDAGDFLIG